MRRRFIQLVLMMLALAAYAAAQAGSTTSPLPSQDESVELNQLSGHIGSGIAYDDNLGAGSEANGGFRYNVEPTLYWDHNNPRMGWRFGVGTGLLGSSGISTGQRKAGDNFSADAEFGFRYLITPHFRWVLFDHFSRTSDVFNSFTTHEPTNFINPFAIRVTHVPGTDFTYYFSTRTILQAGGFYNMLRYMDLGSVDALSPQGQPIDRIVSTKTLQGHVFLMRHVTEKNWAGVEYDFQDIRTDRGACIDDPNPQVNNCAVPSRTIQPNPQSVHEIVVRTQVHDFFATDQYQLRPDLTIAVFGGPELTHVGNPVVELPIFGFIEVIKTPFVQEGWGLAGGATLTFDNPRVTAELKLVRHVSAAQGLLGTLRVNEAQLNARYHLTRRWDVLLDSLWTQGKLIELISKAGLKNWSVGPGVSWKVAPEWTVGAHYEHQFQNRFGFAGILNEHNRGFVSVEYTFKHHLGS